MTGRRLSCVGRRWTKFKLDNDRETRAPCGTVCVRSTPPKNKCENHGAYLKRCWKNTRPNSTYVCTQQTECTAHTRRGRAQTVRARRQGNASLLRCMSSRCFVDAKTREKVEDHSECVIWQRIHKIKYTPTYYLNWPKHTSLGRPNWSSRSYVPCNESSKCWTRHPHNMLYLQKRKARWCILAKQISTTMEKPRTP